MNATKDHYEIATLRLRQARRAMRGFAEMSADEVGKVILDEAYLALLDDLRRFARCQYGLMHRARPKRHEPMKRTARERRHG